MIERIVKNNIVKSLDNFSSTAILGARQIGKTTLAIEISNERPTIYLDLESNEDLQILKYDVNFFEKNNDKLIILDEIQKNPEIFSKLRGIIDVNRRNGRENSQFLFLGSASMDLLSQSSQSLAGRINYIDMFGLNLIEVGQENYLQLWLRGGFPKSYLAKDDELSFIFRESLIRTYLERDISQFGYKIPADRLRILWTMLAHLQGENINELKLAANIGVDRKTIVKYIDILQDLLLLRKIQPWFANVKKRLVKSPKTYIRDSGILHKLLGIEDYNSLITNPVIGKSFEGFVIENILSVISQTTQYFFYRSHAGAEIDLLLQISSKELWAIEIKNSSTPKLERGFHEACNDVSPTRKFVVYQGAKKYEMNNEVVAIGLYELMQEIKNFK